MLPLTKISIYNQIQYVILNIPDNIYIYSIPSQGNYSKI